MRILVTGTSGQVGSATAKFLQAHAAVIGTDRAALDLSKLDLIPQALDKIAPELVINTAAYTAVDRSEQEPALAQRVNADAPGVMAQWCASHQIPLIHFSTDYVFDGHGERPWSEDDPTHPLSTYGATKLAGENQVSAAGGCFLIIRTSWVYAALGTNFLRKIAELATQRKELRIVVDQVGAPTSAALIAELLGKMLEPGLTMFRQRAAEAHGLIHLAAAGEASWHEFARQIIAGLRSRGVYLIVEEILPILTLEYPLPAQRPMNSRLNLNRLQAVFGIRPPYWQEALEPELDRLAQELCRQTR